MKRIKKIPKLPLALIVICSTLFLLPLTVQAARLDTHTGIVKADGSDMTAYLDSSCTNPNGHYICHANPQDWYEYQYSADGNVELKYPITIELDPGDPDVGHSTATHWFSGSDYYNNADSDTGIFWTNWTTTQWYNHLPSDITYTDVTNDGDTGNFSEIYVSNNQPFSVTNPDMNGNSTLMCGNTPIMQTSDVPYNYQCYYNRNDRINCDYVWTRAQQAWSTNGLVQGSNDVNFAGTDASGNYTTGHQQFLYDNVPPVCTSVQIQNKTSNGYDVYVYGVNDPGVSNGTGSGVATVKFPTWSGDSQADIRWDSGTDLGGGTWMYHVDVANFNGDLTGYCTQVYIYDNAGNYSQYIACNGMSLGGVPSASGNGNKYHTNIDVITAITVNNTTGVDETSGCSVTLNISGITNQTNSFVIPAGENELVWFKWHTPSTPQNVTATYTVNTPFGSTTVTPTYNIEVLNELTPPDPKGRDTAPPGFYIPSFTSTLGAVQNTLSWGEYSVTVTQQPYAVTVTTADPVTGDPITQTRTCYKTVDVWNYVTHAATATATLKLSYDPSCPPTAFIGTDGLWNMKSGYGIEEAVTTNVTCDEPEAVTAVQTVASAYPEFNYLTYYRLLENIGGVWQLKVNPFTNPVPALQGRVHYTPPWYPDGDYTVEAYATDTYTPAGCLGAYGTDTVHIKGALYDDYYVHPFY